MKSRSSNSSPHIKNSKSPTPHQRQPEDYSSKEPGMVCLNCGMAFRSGRQQIKLKDNQIATVCPFCYEEGQITSFRELLHDSENLREAIKELELR